MPGKSALPARDVQCRATRWGKQVHQGRHIRLIVGMVIARNTSELHPVLGLRLAAPAHRHTRKPVTAGKLTHDPNAVLGGAGFREP